MKLILFSLLSFIAQGQVTATLSSPGTIASGQTATITISLTAVTAPTALQWITTWDANAWSNPVAAIGPVATAAGKGITCGQIPSGMICELDGPNQTVIQNGIIATVTLTAGGLLGSTPLALTAPIASDSTGVPIGATAPAPASIIITTPISPCDLNSDGKTDQADVSIARARVLASSTVPDLDRVSPWTVIDLQRMQNAAGGAACNLG